jgi:hypothetical protein
MARQVFTNNAESTLATALTVGGLSFDVQPGTGSRFPVLTAGDYALITFTTTPVESDWEIVEIEDRTGDTFTISAGGRAQEGTTALAWPIGTRVSARLTADGLNAFYRNDEVIEEPFSVATSAAGALDFDLAVGNNNFQVTLFENVTSITFSNVPASGKVVPLFIEFNQDGTGGWTVGGWPAEVKFSGGIAPVISPGIGAKDLVTGYTLDNGTTINLGRALEDLQ